MKEKRARDERLQIMLSPDELAAVDDFRFKKRMPKSSSCGSGVAAAGACRRGFGLALAGAKSTDFGVTGDAPSQMRRGAERR